MTAVVTLRELYEGECGAGGCGVDLERQGGVSVGFGGARAFRGVRGRGRIESSASAGAPGLRRNCPWR